ncbi:MAG TPA: hypothetical protein VF282_10425 [Bacillota bacterium]
MLAAAESTIRAAETVLGFMAAGAAAVLVWLVVVILRSVTNPRP